MSTLLNNPFAVNDDTQDNEIPGATLAIYNMIAEKLMDRDNKDVNRASAATMCVRRRWYQRMGAQGTPLTPRKIINFALGDLTELVMISFIKESLVGPGKLYSEVDFGKETGSIVSNGKKLCTYEQKTLTWEISQELKITAHLDGLGKRNLDDKWEIIECKSSSSYGFEEFKESGPGDYLNQAHACMQTKELTDLGVRSIRYFYLRKDTGNIWDRLHFFDQKIADKVKHDFISASLDAAPDRPHGYVQETFRGKPTGKEKLGFPCNYCSFIGQCFPSAQKEFKSGKPVWYRSGNVATENKGETK